jgi:hypothetical protein
MGCGFGVTEMEPTGKAAAEVRQLWAWTKQHMSMEQNHA